MKSRRLAVACLAVCLSVAAGPLAVAVPSGGPVDGESVSGQAVERASSAVTAAESAAGGPTNGSTTVDLDESDRRQSPDRRGRAARPDGTGRFVVTAVNRSAVDTERLSAVAASVGSRHGRYVEVEAAESAVATLRDIEWVTDVRPAAVAERTGVPVGGSPTRADRDAPVVSEGVESMAADRLHASNVTGAGVRVGVLTLGVDPTAPGVARQVAGTSSFHPDGMAGSGTTHGTAVAEVVADTAPNASLYLATFQTDVDYANAVSWLRERDVDVVVMSVGFYGLPDDGSSLVSHTATEATEEGVVWVNSAGNAGERHWQGPFEDTDGDGWLNVNGSDEANHLNGGRQLSAGTRVTLRLKWNEFPTADEDYTLYLMDASRDVVATSARYPSTPRRPTERLVTRLPHGGEYFFAVAGNGSARVEVTGSYTTRPFEHTVRRGSITPPALADGVTAAGAYHVDTGKLAPYSAGGGRVGTVDLLGPSKVTTVAYDRAFTGTSAAAPHVGGAAALLSSVNESALASAVERALAAGATDAGPPGFDSVTGAGTVNVTASAETLDPSVPLSVDANRSEVAVGDPVTYTVRRRDTGDRVAASVTVGNRTVQTGSDGEAVLVHREAGPRVLTATAASDPPTADFELGVRRVVVAEENATGFAVADYDTDDDGTVTGDLRGVLQAVSDYNEGELTFQRALRVIAAYTDV